MNSGWATAFRASPVLALIAAFSACGSSRAECVQPPDVACHVTDLTISLAVSEMGAGAVSSVELSNIAFTPVNQQDAARAAPRWSCSSGGIGANQFTTCHVQGAPGAYDFDVTAPGLNAKHVTVMVPPHVPTECCPVDHVLQRMDVHLWRPLDPACASEFGSVAPEDVAAAYSGITCEVNPDLPPPPEVPGTCAGLMPPRVEGRSITVASGRGDFCGQPSSDGTGSFMAPLHEKGLISLLPEAPAFWGGDANWWHLGEWTARVIYAPVVAGPSGFQVFDLGHRAEYPGKKFAVYDSRGHESRVVEIDWPEAFELPSWPSHVAADGRGGSVFTVMMEGCSRTVYGVHVMPFAPDGAAAAPRFAAMAISAEAFEARAPDRFKAYPRRVSDAVVAGVDGDGRILVAWEGGVSCGARTIAARWFDRSGSPLTPVFRAATNVNPPLRIAQLIDGSLALQTLYDGAWVARFVAPHAASGPVPPWLAARSGRIQIVRGGRAYAAFPNGTECNPRIELLSSSGEVCGVLEYPKVPGALDEPCDPSWFWPAGRLHVGFDGSVARLRRATHYENCALGNHCCEYEWWLGELR